MKPVFLSSLPSSNVIFILSKSGFQKACLYRDTVHQKYTEQALLYQSMPGKFTYRKYKNYKNIYIPTVRAAKKQYFEIN
jgi:hypothetical protein